MQNLKDLKCSNNLQEKANVKVVTWMATQMDTHHNVSHARKKEESVNLSTQWAFALELLYTPATFMKACSPEAHWRLVVYTGTFSGIPLQTVRKKQLSTFQPYKLSSVALAAGFLWKHFRRKNPKERMKCTSCHRHSHSPCRFVTYFINVPVSVTVSLFGRQGNGFVNIVICVNLLFPDCLGEHVLGC